MSEVMEGSGTKTNMKRMSPGVILMMTMMSVVTCQTPEKMSSSCDNKIQLECGEGEMIVVHQAAFTPQRGGEGKCDNKQELDIGSGSLLHNNRDILLAVVRRCSGVRDGQCTFDMSRDLAESVSWGRGRTDLGYSCEAGVLSYCGGRVTVSGEGYISSPGYPRYYLGGRECVWTILAEQGQRIELEVVDLALRDTGDKCEDSVQVREEGLTLMSLCGDLDGRANVVSTSRGVELRMRTAPSGQSLYPHRGLLLHYNVQGCPTPGPIADGRVEVSHDGSTASLHCNTDHVLQSSLSPSQELACDNVTWTWSPSIAHCVSIQFLLQYANATVVNILTGGQALKLQDSNSSFSTEFELELVATILVGVLLLVSALIAVFVLYRFRKSQELQGESDERMKLSEEGQVDTSVTEMGRY